MKKNILLLAGSLALCLGTAEAQQRDSTSNKSTDQARNPRMTQEKNRNSSYNANDVEILQNDQIPAALKESLQDEKYAGWENAIIYHNKKTGEYLVSPRAHRFDSEGNPIDYPGAKPSKKTMKSSDMSQRDRTSSQQRSQSQSGNDQSGGRRDSTSVSGEQSSSPTQQDTAMQSSQAQSATDQGRQQSTSGRMQQDTASEKSSQGQYGNADRYRTEGSTTDMAMEGMVMVQPSEIPVALKETLNDDQYKGWETGKLYRHESTDEYVLVMDEKTAGEGQQTYRFDKDGKMINNSSDKRRQKD
jgi:hypothetical protein